MLYVHIFIFFVVPLFMSYLAQMNAQALTIKKHVTHVNNEQLLQQYFAFEIR